MGKGVARAHVQMYFTLDLRKMLTNGSLETHQISVKSVQLFPNTEKGSHVRTCRCIPLFTCVKRLAT